MRLSKFNLQIPRSPVKMEKQIFRRGVVSAIAWWLVLTGVYVKDKELWADFDTHH